MAPSRPLVARDGDDSQIDVGDLLDRHRAVGNQPLAAMQLFVFVRPQVAETFASVAKRDQ